MFCPECGTLGFMESNGNIRCTKYTCGYEGPLAGKDGKGADFIDPITKETIDLSKVRTFSEFSTMKHLNEVIPDNVFNEETRKWTPIIPENKKSEDPLGTLWVGDYLCPKCDADRIFVLLMQTRSSDQPETKICTCASCGHKFREYL